MTVLTIIGLAVTVVFGLLAVITRDGSSEPIPSPTLSPTVSAIADPPSPTPTATTSEPEPTPSPTTEPESSTPSSPPATDEPDDDGLPYKANFANWTEANGWKRVGRMLVNNGTQYGKNMTIEAPVDLSDVPDYAVEADIRLTRYGSGGQISGLNSFGIVVRASEGPNSGYAAGDCASAGFLTCIPNGPRLAAAIWPLPEGKADARHARNFLPRRDKWYRYRVEAKGETIRFYIDDAIIAKISDLRYTDGGSVGLWSDHCQISVKNFTVRRL